MIFVVRQCEAISAAKCSLKGETALKQLLILRICLLGAGLEKRDLKYDELLTYFNKNADAVDRAFKP